MPTLRLTDEQVMELVRQLSPERKRTALLALAEEATAQRAERMEHAERQLRCIAGERGQDWDALGDEDRQDRDETIIHYCQTSLAWGYHATTRTRGRPVHRRTGLLNA